ncbi:MAG: hypothetical protein EBW54_12600 [Betaproteobacteria bacterium]|nr:hypothetical protein [Betaproteobacteria bacterium]
MQQSPAAQQQAQQAAQDPIVQMQQRELAIKEADQQRKTQKDQADAMLKAKQLSIEEQRIMAQAKDAAERTKNDMLKTAAQMRDDREKLIMKDVLEVMKPTKKGS